MKLPRIQLRNWLTGKRERVLGIGCLIEAAVPQFELIEDPRRLLTRLGFDVVESDFLIASAVEGYPPRELPWRLGCDPDEVERRRKQVERKIIRLRYEAASENRVFGTDE